MSVNIKGRCRACGLVQPVDSLAVDTGQHCSQCGRLLLVDIVEADGLPQADPGPLELEKSGESTPPSPPVAVPPASVETVAAALGIDLATIQGTGPEGAVTFEDIESAVKARGD